MMIRVSDPASMAGACPQAGANSKGTLAAPPGAKRPGGASLVGMAGAVTVLGP